MMLCSNYCLIAVESVCGDGRSPCEDVQHQTPDAAYSIARSHRATVDGMVLQDPERVHMLLVLPRGATSRDCDRGRVYVSA